MAMAEREITVPVWLLQVLISSRECDFNNWGYCSSHLTSNCPQVELKERLAEAGVLL